LEFFSTIRQQVSTEVCDEEKSFAWNHGRNNTRAHADECSLRQKGNGRAPCADMSIEERLEKIEHDVEVLRKEVRDLLQRFLKYVEDVEEDPVKD
jgi:hypothetical protein